ncbi:arginine repressor [Lactococcus garvieae]|jgi:transcriptional regulator of arginine metabolism|uniref:Arginine repressor n=1 Tax=Lactococcus garvieae DCC43 TaxID=1231377 RepID=K2QE22_9LACT|nr:transcriptional regulator [Lactococcus garvieae]EKF51627.1 Arginine pathway regulatory protein ArgR, repressor of arg regulon [Lactococcus garvieae DCC43]QPS71375.1 transcriptional regulator [Lactococcus garvieae]
MRREERLDFISRLITAKEVQTQDELVHELLENDIDVTQATVSRDIKTLALIKIPGSRGGYRYALPQQHDDEQKDLLHKELASEAILEMKIQENMISIIARPGTTSVIKKSLISRYNTKIFSVMTDDDSILVICETRRQANTIYDELSL